MTASSHETQRTDEDSRQHEYEQHAGQIGAAWHKPEHARTHCQQPVGIGPEVVGGTRLTQADPLVQHGCVGVVGRAHTAIASE